MSDCYDADVVLVGQGDGFFLVEEEGFAGHDDEAAAAGFDDALDGGGADDGDVEA